LFPNLVPSPGRRSIRTLALQAMSLPLAAYELMHLRRFIRSWKPDIVNIHYLSYPAVYALVAAASLRIPAVLSFHGSDVAGSPYPATYGIVERLAVGRAQAVTLNSKNLASFLRGNLNAEEAGKITVIPFGVDDRPVADEGASGDFALVAARLVEKKGVETAIRAMAGLDTAAQGLRLVIAGDGPLRNPLQDLSRQLGLEQRVEFIGELSPDELNRRIDQAKFVIVPSLWEAYGVIALEAMVAGRAVVAGSHGGIAEITVDGQTGILIPPGDANALAAAISQLATDPDRAAAMGRAGRERALEYFGWPKVVEEYEMIFDKVIGEAQKMDKSDPSSYGEVVG
jgi:glycosyltransferase involved in cell wall biosynthesis